MHKEDNTGFVEGAIWGASVMFGVFIACYAAYLFTKTRRVRRQHSDCEQRLFPRSSVYDSNIVGHSIDKSSYHCS